VPEITCGMGVECVDSNVLYVVLVWGGGGSVLSTWVCVGIYKQLLKLLFSTEGKALHTG
jgi:hypothetical protein